eukprot:4127609-Prymnesium_polylepis.1
MAALTRREHVEQPQLHLHILLLVADGRALEQQQLGDHRLAALRHVEATHRHRDALRRRRARAPRLVGEVLARGRRQHALRLVHAFGE